ncbi:glycosyltransferase family 4 protein [Paenibacillus roseipurpureus]|uniref:Glycosyltransferase family 4 protein n=1 Tax=Paenibacillus roseopurpureus TaxID=2918901 RepID=A0AA96RLJ6_9BACL|nr:glycosyltransferase family 4 protein [Paenibacillus sp. MBLB1832]WNR45740.1 glycosyltransferase family 4 protein [Paenibacillus sp. MBLB1832]
MKTKRKSPLPRLVIVTPGSFPIPSGNSSSVEQVIQKTAEHLVKRMPVYVLGRKAPNQPWKEIKQGIAYRRVRYQGPKSYISHIHKEISRLRPNIIQVDNRPRFLGILRKKHPKAILSLVLHSTTFITEPHISKKALTACLQGADVIIVNSDFLKRYLQQEVPSAARKIKTHYLGVDTGQFTSKWSVKGQETRKLMRKKLDCENCKIILFVGRLISKKGVHHLIEAMHRVIESEPTAKLVLVGSAFYGSDKVTGYVKGLVKSAKKLSNHVTFIPYVKHQEMPKWIGIADVLVVPSIGPEAFGLVNVEAMATGVPVIATRVGGIQEVIEHGQTGYLVDPANIKTELPENILRVIKDENLQRTLGENGLRRVNELFTWQKAAQVRFHLYSQMRKETALV